MIYLTGTGPAASQTLPHTTKEIGSKDSNMELVSRVAPMAASTLGNLSTEKSQAKAKYNTQMGRCMKATSEVASRRASVVISEKTIATREAGRTVKCTVLVSANGSIEINK